MVGITNFEEKKNEAIKRMRQLNMAYDVVRGFKVQSRVCASESAGFLYWVTNEEQKVIDEFENTSDNLVYHVIRSKGPDNMDLLTLLYVSKYEEEWETDMKGIKTRTYLDIQGKRISACEMMAYVHNSTVSVYSEYGYVYVLPINGGLLRAY